MWALYRVVSATALFVGGPFLLLARGKHYLPTLRERFGHTEPPRGRRPIWIHAVSVGEAGVAARLAQALPDDLPLLVTTVTPTGQERARALLGDRAQVTYLPFELQSAIRRFFDRYRPSALILSEGDLWPLVLREAVAAEIPVALVSGRISDRSFARLQRFRRWLGPLYDPVQLFGMQTEVDRRRLLELGVDPARVHTTGNLKFEIPAPDLAPDLGARIEALAAGRPILVAGSTMRDEERLVLDAFGAVAESALLVLAPRHPERWDEVAALLEERGWVSLRRSRWQEGESGPGGEAPCQVLLLDSLGELAGVYRLARAVFVGGTLVPTGGHNPLEPAMVAAGIAAGPSMENFRQMEELFDRAGAWRRVGDADELGAVWAEWTAEGAPPPAEGERARQLVEANRGSLARTLEILEPVLAEARRHRERP